jgi:hypothetical protein
MDRTAFYWDFFGPDAEGTATHHAKHLREAVEKNRWQGSEVHVYALDAEAGHWVAELVAPSELEERIRGALKPRRSAEVPSY